MYQTRICKHRSTIRTQHLLLPIPFHFQRGHSISQKYQIIEYVTVNRRGGNIKEALRRRKAFWIHKLGTMEPKGLNQEYEIAHLSCQGIVL